MSLVPRLQRVRPTIQTKLNEDLRKQAISLYIRINMVVKLLRKHKLIYLFTFIFDFDFQASYHELSRVRVIILLASTSATWLP